MSLKNRIIVGSAAALLAMAGTASAAPELRDLGFGWQVLLPDADLIDIVVDEAASNSGQLVIEKFATFMDLNALDLVFTQTGANAAPRIIITDEFIANQTGQNWVGFTNSLINASSGTTAAFNPAASAGLSISPFTTVSYSSGNTVMDFGGGTVVNGAFWFPGLAMGALVVDVALNPGGGSTFTLREVPQVPTPGTMALTLLAGLVATRRKR